MAAVWAIDAGERWYIGATAVAKVTDGARWASPARVVNESRAAMCEQLIES